MRRPVLTLVDGLLAIGVAVVIAAVVAATLVPKGTSLGERARTLDAELRCPTCQTVSIADSPAAFAQSMRALVREQLAAGASDDEVRRFFTERYGDWILLSPPASGPSLVLWVIPSAALAAGGLLIVRRLRRTHRVIPSIPTLGANSRWAGGASALVVAAFVAVPLALAVGPRLGGTEITGRPAAGEPIPALEAAVAAEPASVEAWVALADAYVAAGRFDEAAERYRRALALDPADVPAGRGAAGLLIALDRPADAVPLLDRILRSDPEQADALLLRGIARIRLGGSSDAGAVADLRRFLALAPDDLRATAARELLAAGASPTAP